MCIRDRSGSMGSLRCAIGVDGFIRGRWLVKDAPWWLSGSSGVARFIVVRPRGRLVPPGSSECALRLVGLIRGRCVHRGAS